jgi:hypothetical protein
MTDITPTNMIPKRESPRPEQTYQQTPPNQASPASPQEQQSQAVSSSQRATPGRMPLFRR